MTVHFILHEKVIEVKTPVSKKDYENLLNHADAKTLPVFKTRRVFMHRNQQYQLDIYRFARAFKKVSILYVRICTLSRVQRATQYTPPQ